MLRELTDRTSDDLRVTLYWQDDDDTLTIEVEDFRDSAGDYSIVGIPPADRKTAFEHPLVYCPPVRPQVAA